MPPTATAERPRAGRSPRFVTAISLPPHLHQHLVEAAADMGQTQAGYIRWLIAQDRKHRAA